MSDQVPENKKAFNITSNGGFKIAMLVVLILILLVPITMLRSLVEERSHRADVAEELIMEAWGSELTLYGPVIRIPVEEVQGRGQNRALWITPGNVDIQMNFSAEKKRRGIFSVALFSGEVSMSGNFSFDRVELNLNQRIYPEQAEIIIGLANQKGIRRIIKADWNGEELFFKPGNRNFLIYSGNGSGINASSPFIFNREGANTFDIQFVVQGGKAMRVLPIGETTLARIQADWPSPSFQGGFLPTDYTLTESGFDADWEISYLSRSIPLFWFSDERSGYEDRSGLRAELFGVDFFKPLDHYALNERAVKYAILFLVVPFLTLFFLEIFSKKSIHPVQYLLSGLANVIFYLLLLSFSEHLSFSLAYLVAAAALTGMLSLYARSLLETWVRSSYMALVMALLYLLMYLTLNAEDWALLIGSVAAFFICGIVMFLTRKLDWNNLSIKGE